MKIAFHILAHNNPKHLERLIKSLVSMNCIIFVHIDRNSSIDDFSNCFLENVIFIKNRIAVYWGDFSIVEATIRLLLEARKCGSAFDYHILLSGSDYPLRSGIYIEQFLRANKGKEFINIVPMPNIPAGKPISRLTFYKISPSDPKISSLARRMLVKAGAISLERNFQSVLGSMKPYAGSQWWGLTANACDLILSFVKNNPKIVEFFRHTRIPDEMFFQTILGNSSLFVNVERNFTYAIWLPGEPSPTVLSKENLISLASKMPVVLDDVYGKGEALFARKFSDNSQELIIEIDKCRLE
jgi:hypothetical protein